jgi:hypothetical protein
VNGKAWQFKAEHSGQSRLGLTGGFSTNAAQRTTGQGNEVQGNARQSKAARVYGPLPVGSATSQRQYCQWLN